jgi:exonuclease VII large subunit
MSDELDLGATTEAFGVRQFIGKVNHAMKSTFTPGIWVHGEIESWSNRTQHAYFQLLNAMKKAPQQFMSHFSQTTFAAYNRCCASIALLCKMV